MLQGLIWGKGTEKAGEREALKGTQGKKINMLLHTCYEFSPRFCNQSCGIK
jgi:hypothetical protein